MPHPTHNYQITWRTRLMLRLTKNTWPVLCANCHFSERSLYADQPCEGTPWT